MDNNKLISREKFFSFVHDWIKPLVDTNNDLGGGFECKSGPLGFNWCLKNSEGAQTRFIGTLLIDDHWEISNGDKKYMNIQIFNDHIEFIEDSRFVDFTRDKMFSLYEFLNKRIFNKEDDIPKSIDKNVEDSKTDILTDEDKEYIKRLTNKSNILGTKSESNNIKVDTDADINTYGDGAIRSSKKGKGRYDLIPGCVMLDVLKEVSFNVKPDISDEKMKCILMKRIFDHDWINAIVCLTELGYDGETPIDSFNKMIKELALHYENGAEIYGENNWKKGIPKESFISSGIRHTQQWLSGLDDEPHLISAIWNFTNAEWCEHKEKLYK